MTTPFGTPFQVQPRSVVSTIIVEPTLGLDTSRSPLNIAQGATPNSENFIMRDGRLAPRPMLSTVTEVSGATTLFDARCAGGIDMTNVEGRHYLIFSPSEPATNIQNRTLLRVLKPGRVGSHVSYVQAFGVSDLPALSASDFWDWTQIFYDQANENIAVAATTTRQGLYCWAPESEVYSTLTGSPNAKCVAAFDHYLLAGNTQEGGETFIQRVRWSDRGSVSSWTGGLSGFEDLLGAKGGINRILPWENRVAVFFDDEIWTGDPVDFPSTFKFAPLDTTKGCPFPQTATITPLGIMFMARDYQVYLLPKGGGSPVPVGQKLHRSILNSIVQAPRAFAVYDGLRDMYQLYYSSGESGYVPHRAAWLHLDTGAWAPQSFASGSGANQDLGISYGFGAQIAISRASTWADLTMTWEQLNVSWNDLMGFGNERQSVLLCSSGGTAYELRSDVTRDAESLAVRSFWESDLLGEEWADQQKIIQEVRSDYSAKSASSITVRARQSTTFDTGRTMALPASSAVSQSAVHAYVPSRYPAIRVESEGQQDVELHRFYVQMRVGGR